MSSLNSFVAKGTRFTLPSHYTSGRFLGNGAFGVVISATDARDGQQYAVKKLVDAFACPGDAKRFFREICLMRHLNHENIVSFHDMFLPAESAADDFNDVYIVSKLMPCNLRAVLRDRPSLSNDHFKHLMYQLVSGLQYMHSAGVIHRDIKPANILVDGSCGLQICDLGLSRSVSRGNGGRGGGDGGDMTQYVCTRWYRAPELMLDYSRYGPAVDMWSAGCVFAELLTCEPLFRCGDYMSMLRMIARLVGTPSAADTAFLDNARARRFMAGLPVTRRADFGAMFPATCDAGRDLLSRMLTFNPAHRITAAEALRHPFFAGVHDPSAPLPHCAQPFRFPFDECDVDADTLRPLISQQVAAVQAAMLQQQPTHNSSSSNNSSGVNGSSHGEATAAVRGKAATLDANKPSPSAGPAPYPAVAALPSPSTAAGSARGSLPCTPSLLANHVPATPMFGGGGGNGGTPYGTPSHRASSGSGSSGSPMATPSAQRLRAIMEGCHTPSSSAALTAAGTTHWES